MTLSNSVEIKVEKKIIMISDFSYEDLVYLVLVWRKISSYRHYYFYLCTADCPIRVE